MSTTPSFIFCNRATEFPGKPAVKGIENCVRVVKSKFRSTMSDWGKSKYEGLTFDIDDLDVTDGGSYGGRDGHSPSNSQYNSQYNSEEEESFARTFKKAMENMNAISNDPVLWIRLVSAVFGTCVDELSPPDAQEVYKVMNRRLRDLKLGTLEGVWSREMRLRGHSI
ncbi:hypothetical protein TrRE_jg13033 [Triparma retinervis]|uniref:Uncharacterized protein n=1 Tax=Triparma retinervis TaxID=2557542 RepID=A0A9W6ZIB9_9STRA|nr:hypothetical protein TrRE_jg13033 [Triparma retinervis]